MKKMIKLTISMLALSLAGCAALGGPPLQPGDPAAAVTAKMGQPTAVHRLDGGQLLEFTTGPFGQFTYMARIGADGKLASFEQVLTGEKFATIQIGIATKEDVLRTIGHPAETSTLPRQQLEVWTYRYKEAGVWNSLMHVHFDRAGIVRMMQNGPDPEREPGRFR